MNLKHRLQLKGSDCPLRICLVPCDYSSAWNQHEQCLIAFEKRKTLSVYDIDPTENKDKVQFLEEKILDIEPDYVDTANNDRSTLFIRNRFHIALYKREVAQKQKQ
ncbi:unnamed protein product [Rotaria magnacalcarata]|uniref:Uncharacterized protein n=1 Tax=Rotaria magnacalcarata TaxID=392030 RepID=A0A8S2R6N8_9BILA|nr:unnamed protein product [Rotaria magnacalcarata]CAF4417965.1 unnamed protein product [Rotaria magnacalcarata]